MLRPERMSRVSVTGARAVMPAVVEAVHELNLVHLSEYDGSWDRFEPGDPDTGAEAASEKLVTIRSIKSILGVTEEDAGTARTVDVDGIESELEAIRTEVNELDDRRDALESELDDIESEIETVEPFAELGIDLDLLSGYDSLDVAVGEADPDAVEEALAHTDGVRQSEVLTGGDLVAVFVYPSEGADDPLGDALVNVEFARVGIPDASGDPEARLDELARERGQIESRLDSVENDIEELRLEHGADLLAFEEELQIRVERAEAPLQFATTERSFVAEGWVPAERYTEFVEAVRDAVGDRVEIEELERADYTPSGGHSHEAPDEEEAVADGGTATRRMGEDDPPVVQDNPGAVKPFELLVQTINRPRYSEIDPTFALFLTFPAFYGFMIGDLAYGLLYAGIGYWLWTGFDSDAIRSLGGVAMWAGAFTTLFGVLYGEILGLHLITEYLWVGTLGLEHAPIRKGLHTIAFAKAWLTLSVVIGVAHLAVGWGFGFVNDSRAHGLKDAILEDGSWIMLMVGLWTWVFSAHLAGPKPDFLVGATSVFAGNPLPLGFTGFPVAVGYAGLAVALVGFALVVAGEGAVGLLESPNALVNVISYTRIAAVLLAKAGMAFFVNLIVFGAYEHHHEVHFMLDGHSPAGAEILFPGLVHAGIGGALGAFLILVLGHALVLALGVTSAGLQAVRLEYVEFFNKFYEGGGANYEPFGHRRTHTTEE